MPVFAQKPKAATPAAPAMSRIRARPLCGRDMSSIGHSQLAIGKPAVQRLPDGNAGGVRAEAASDIALIGHDFSRIPIHAAGAIQARLTINQPGDRFEREADRVADRVMRMVEPMPIGSARAPVQRKCAECQGEEEESVLAERVLPAAALRPSQETALRSAALQGVTGQEDDDTPVRQAVVLRKAGLATPRTAGWSGPALADTLAARQGGGEPLPEATRQSMESAFGYDFARVRVHRDAEAGKISRRLNALAFTHGRHIYFRDGMYDPGGSSGRRLLAHELTHVVQQGQAARRHWGGSASPSASSQASAPTIQRAATWAAGSVHEVNNLASAIVNGTSVGVTWPKLNGQNSSAIWSAAAMRAALNRPTVSFSPASGGGVDASVATVPTNTGSFDETVLAAGPWRTVAPKATIGRMLPTLTTCTGAGNTTFRAIGDPSDDHMYNANRRHEDRHAADHQAAFNASIVPWDTRLTTARTAGTTYHGADNAAAEAALHTAMGGTPDQIADAFFNGCAAAVVAYHSTPAGGAVGAPTSPRANADCSTSSAKYRNPS